MAGVLISAVIAVLWLNGNVRLSWNGQVTGALTVGLALAVSSGIIEELLMRGVVFRIVEQWLGSGVALAVSAVLFGGLHAFNPGATVVSCVAIAIEAGILLAAAYMYTRRLWLAIGIHLGWNFFEGSVYGASVSGGKMASLFASDFSGHPLLTGGKFGPEASVVAMVVCSAAGLWLLQRVRKRRSTTNPQVSRSQ
jgi:membrane protease YdiL (CAAX protease family)